MIDFEKEYKVKFISNSDGSFSIDFKPFGNVEPMKEIDLIIKDVEDGFVFFDVSSNTTENFLLYVQGYPGIWKYKIWEDSYVTEFPLPVGVHSMYIIDTVQNLKSPSQDVVVVDENPLPICIEGPRLVSVSSPNNQMVKFEFYGKEVWEIAWSIEGENGLVSQGICKPTSSFVDLWLNEILPDGEYVFTIQGHSCKSQPESKTFKVGSEIVEPPSPPSGIGTEFVFEEIPVFQNDTIGANRWSLDTTNLRAGRTKPQTAKILKGTSITTLSAVENELGEWHPYDKWEQEFHVTSSDVNNIVQKGNMTYFFAPKGYKRDASDKLYDFFRLFPKFELPKGRMFVLQSGKGTREFYGGRNTWEGYSELVYDVEAQKQMIERGVTHVKGFEDISPKNSMKFLGDALMLETGYPDGRNPIDREQHKREVYEWSLRVTPKQVFDVWHRVHFSDPSSHDYLGKTAYYMWNFELQWAWPIMNQHHFKEFIRIVNDFTEKNYPNLLFAIWRKCGLRLKRNDNTSYNFYDDFLRIYHSKNPSEALEIIKNSQFALNKGLEINEAFIGTKMGQQIGFYQTSFNSKENPALYLMEFIMNKRVSPLSDIVLTYFTDCETTEGGDVTGKTELFTFNGLTRAIHHKARVGNNTMRGLGVFTIAFGQGVDFWDILKWNPDTREWEFTSKFFGMEGGDALPNDYVYTSVQNISDFACGAYSVSVNKDIVESSKDWVPVRNNAWEGFSNAYTQDAMIMWKLSEDEKEALVIAWDFSCIEAKGTEEWEVEIKGNKYVIETSFRTPVVVRIKL